MTIKKCGNCSNDVPEGGQCSECGFVHGLNRPPTDQEFKLARQINEKFNYQQFKSIDMLLLD